MVSKTREKFIEVARQLFARKGVENTTMNDIASSAAKGPRTIYTYFKSKRDIFNAVVENETDLLLKSLRMVLARPMSASEKFEQYIRVHFEVMREIVSRNGSLRAGFFLDLRKVDKARRIISRKEVAILREILEEGVASGEFSIDDTQERAVVITHAVYGLDVAYIRDSLVDKGVDKEQLVDSITQLFLNGIRNHR